LWCKGGPAMRPTRAALCLAALLTPPLAAAAPPVTTASLPAPTPELGRPAPSGIAVTPLLAPDSAREASGSIPGIIGIMSMPRGEAAETKPRCRQYRSTVTIDGAAAQGVATMCQTADGNWKLAE